MNILILGSTGFIGKNLTEYLSPEFMVSAPIKRDVNLLDYACTKNYINHINPDIIIHSACVPTHRNHQPINDAVRDNLKMVLNVVYSKKPSTKLIWMSSGAIYNRKSPLVNVNEHAEISDLPLDDLGLSKYLLSLILRQRKDVIELRLFGVFGKYEDYSIRFISNNICRNILGLPMTIIQDRRFSYIDVLDLGRIVKQMMERWPSPENIFNVCLPQSYLLSELASHINTQMQTNTEVIIRTEGLADAYVGNPERLLSTYPYWIPTNISESIFELSKWYISKASQLNLQNIVKYD